VESSSNPSNQGKITMNEELASQLERMGIPRDSYGVRPISRIGKFVAQRLTDAARDTPSFPLQMNVRLDALLSQRQGFIEETKTRISVNDLLIKAAAITLKDVPEVNASFTPDGLIFHHNADVAVAVATESGLITPIVRGAQDKTVEAIAAEMRDLVDRAKTRRLQPDEYSGGTFTISNLGMFGVAAFASIINPPHAAILSVGAAEERVICQDGLFLAAKLMTITLTCDHRVIDGAVGARWLNAFKGLVESPQPLFF
jgi:pyruvate dehydrogenase E2 component (dihydrolipoamide acetyltransferase)